MPKSTTPSGRRRDYTAEAKQHATPASTADRVARNAARQKALASGKVQKGDGTNIDHKDGNPRNNMMSNIQVMTAKANQRKQ